MRTHILDFVYNYGRWTDRTKLALSKTFESEILSGLRSFDILVNCDKNIQAGDIIEYRISDEEGVEKFIPYRYSVKYVFTDPAKIIPGFCVVQLSPCKFSGGTPMQLNG